MWALGSGFSSFSSIGVWERSLGKQEKKSAIARVAAERKTSISVFHLYHLVCWLQAQQQPKKTLVEGFTLQTEKR